jgi:hypothetical protein
MICYINGHLPEMYENEAQNIEKSYQFKLIVSGSTATAHATSEMKKNLPRKWNERYLSKPLISNVLLEKQRTLQIDKQLLAAISQFQHRFECEKFHLRIFNRFER